MKKFRILTLIIALAVIFGGCSASTEEMESKNEYFGGGFFTEDSMAVSPEYPMEMMPEVETEEAITEDSAFDGGDSSFANLSEVKETPQKETSTGRKLIRTINLDVETLDFEEFIGNLKAEISALGGYIESSSVGGNSYNYSYNRNANFTCRIPSEKLDSFIGTVNGLGNITYSYEDTTDVTLKYVDTEARIKSLQTEYDRLLELLAEAENIDTIILLEQRITDVRYQLESYQSQLRTYDNLVDYSTVHLNVNEVKRVTSTEKETVWERISSDFGDNIYSIWIDAQDFFVWFVASIPYFIIWAVIIAAVILVAKRIIKKCPKFEERKAARKAKKEAKKAQKLAEKEENKNAEKE